MMCADGIDRTIVLVCTVMLLASCAPPARPRTPLAPQPTPPIAEEVLKPVEKPKIEIADLNETPSPDRKTVTVSGTLVNRGTGPTHEVYVHVEALDTDGAVVVSADSEPSSETIQPGGTGTFSVMFENRPSIERYHVEAVTR
jgi:hypothetical protein